MTTTKPDLVVDPRKLSKCRIQVPFRATVNEQEFLLVYIHLCHHENTMGIF